jgi:ribosome-associated protein
MLTITDDIAIAMDEIEMRAVRSRGAGGQNVNKVATAIHLRFDIPASSLPPALKQKLLRIKDRRVTKAGVIVIKAQQHRVQELNRQEALDRLKAIILRAMQTRKRRKSTKPTRSSKERRIHRKVRRGRLKALRGRVDPDRS